MAFVILLIIAIAIALLRILIPLLYAFLLAVWLVCLCIIGTIRNEIEERRARKQWREAQLIAQLNQSHPWIGRQAT